MLGVSDLGRLHGQGLGDPSLPVRLPGGPYGLLARSAVRDVTQAAGALRGEAHGDLLAEDRARELRRPLLPEGGQVEALVAPETALAGRGPDRGESGHPAEPEVAGRAG